ncbi:hypothetical protein MRB53_023864 [Persea americana]|uniref:Uncharacterized protein n=1 Tax=Persea americana TaxID=3435 RepID=A0ACC2LAU2_PERAE|nr:hypothetical protein MRB53_023864 [Persea americana]
MRRRFDSLMCGREWGENERDLLYLTEKAGVGEMDGAGEGETAGAGEMDEAGEGERAGAEEKGPETDRGERAAAVELLSLLGNDVVWGRKTQGPFGNLQ